MLYRFSWHNFVSNNYARNIINFYRVTIILSLNFLNAARYSGPSSYYLSSTIGQHRYKIAHLSIILILLLFLARMTGSSVIKPPESEKINATTFNRSNSPFNSYHSTLYNQAFIFKRNQPDEEVTSPFTLGISTPNPKRIIKTLIISNISAQVKTLTPGPVSKLDQNLPLPALNLQGGARVGQPYAQALVAPLGASDMNVKVQRILISSTPNSSLPITFPIDGSTAASSQYTIPAVARRDSKALTISPTKSPPLNSHSSITSSTITTTILTVSSSSRAPTETVFTEIINLIPIAFNIPSSLIPPPAPLKYTRIQIGVPAGFSMKRGPNINMGLVLPQDCRYMSCLSKVAPAMNIALRRSKVQQLLSGVIVNVIEADDNCSQIDGPLAAIRLGLFEKVAVMFGPVCDYAVSPVAIITSRFFNIPLITAGAFSLDFGYDKTKPDSDYPLLTRVGAPFKHVFSFLFKLFRYNRWKRFLILYEPDSHPQINSKFCFHIASGIVKNLDPKQASKDYKWSDVNPSPDDPYHNDSKSGGSGKYTPFISHLVGDIKQLRAQNLSYADILRISGYDFGVIILCASQSTVRKILLAAYDLGMVKSGEYVFFNIELFNKPDHKHRIWELPGETRENNEKARVAYEALFTLTMRMPDSEEYRKFSDQVKEISKRVYGFDYGPENVNAFVSAFHDAVILYALALNETLQAGFNYTDGVEITRRMWNRTFTGITGNVSIDANGDRYTDYSLWDLNPDTGRFQVVLNYYGKENSLVEVPGSNIHWPGGKTSPPLDKPECGYDNSLCRKKEFPKYAIIITFLGSLVCILSVLSFFIYRRYRFEAELGAMKWKIAWEDLMFESLIRDSRKFQSKWSLGKQNQNEKGWYGAENSSETGSDIIADDDTTGTDDDNLSRRRKKSKKRHKSQISDNAFTDHETRQGIKLSMASRSSAGEEFEKHHHHFHENSKRKKSRKMTEVEDEIREMSKIWAGSARVAYYKGAPVVLKPILKKKIEISRDMLMEIKHRKDLQNDYITRFIGACVDVPHACLVMEYCQKGSLKDILENDRLQLDWMFRYSLMHDLTKGMTFLHNSEIKSHGNLKSTNCLVDSRFVLKITDFGLNLLQPSEDKHFRGTMEYYQRKVWTAPELLRMENPPPFGTQKGDVYSFAIIMQEIVLRKGTFYVEGHDFNAKEIVQRVKAGFNEVANHPYLRPTLQGAECEEDVTRLIAKCWSEDPMDRMEFNAIRLLIRKINRENESDNILDNLLSRMEHYANNLEDLVEERTADYLEQKRKAEEVLYQLLPKSVAGQLIRGESVTAESFDSVSIYFSDIVGFTSLSASSTPMQVVDLLNDLYTCFDSTIGSYDVYKVETIGDAYMVVSGLPKRNGNQHAREIAGMAIALQKAVKSFTIRHRPFEQLILRIGIHSGPCVAGVVGLKMPRYCLFGDTVNTASRMESTGKPNMIHISSTTRDLIEPLGIFNLELRGETDVKGKGTLTTYWLYGYNSNKDEAANTPSDVKDRHTAPSSKHTSPIATPKPLSKSDLGTLKIQADPVPEYLETPQLRTKRKVHKSEPASKTHSNLASGGESMDKDINSRCKSTYKTPPSSPIPSSAMGLPPTTKEETPSTLNALTNKPSRVPTTRYLPLNLKGVNSSMGILGSTLSLFGSVPSPTLSPTGKGSAVATTSPYSFFSKHHIFPQRLHSKGHTTTSGIAKSTLPNSKTHPLSSFLNNLASHHQFNVSGLEPIRSRSSHDVALADLNATPVYGPNPQPTPTIVVQDDSGCLMRSSSIKYYNPKQHSSIEDLTVQFLPKPHSTQWDAGDGENIQKNFSSNDITTHYTSNNAGRVASVNGLSYQESPELSPHSREKEPLLPSNHAEAQSFVSS